MQGIWVASIFVALPLLLRTHKAIRAAHVEILSGSAATGAVFAELFMIKSLLVFNPKAKATDDESSSPRWNTSRVDSQSLPACCIAVQTDSCIISRQNVQISFGVMRGLNKSSAPHTLNRCLSYVLVCSCQARVQPLQLSWA